jgi:hypothetical protein
VVTVDPPASWSGWWRARSGLGWLPDGTLLVVSMEDRKLYRLSGCLLQLQVDLSGFRPTINDLVVADGRPTPVVQYVRAGRRVPQDRDPLVTPGGRAARGRARPGIPERVITPDGRRPIVGESLARGHLLRARAGRRLTGRRLFAKPGVRPSALSGCRGLRLGASPIS